MYAFPWGEKGTPLEKSAGPREWQREELLRVADFVKENKARAQRGEDTKVYKRAISSGRGIGKSCLVAWLGLWHISCNPGASCIVTANTDAQLTGRTFGEIGHWAAMAINSYWFDRTQKSIIPAEWWASGIKQARKIDSQYWYIRGELWSEENPDAFAALHNNAGEMVIFDEASGIPAPIWKVTEGIFTEPTHLKFWFVYSNPRANAGAFFDCFHEHSPYWSTKKIDSRLVEGIPKNTYQEIIEKYGEDSRDARVEVRGEFPTTGDNQFISSAVVAEACNRELERIDDYAALYMGVDVARFGDDSTVIRLRRGRDSRSFPAITLRGADNMQVANKIAALIEQFNPDAVCIDSGAGSGVIDRLREMGYHVHEVIFGSSADDSQFYDHRTELWARMKDWLPGAMLGKESEEDRKLIRDLISPEYQYMGKEGKIKLESKEDMKKRLPGIKSPDNADALAVTFHVSVSSSLLATSKRGAHRKSRIVRGTGCDIKFE